MTFKELGALCEELQVIGVLADFGLWPLPDGDVALRERVQELQDTCLRQMRSRPVEATAEPSVEQRVL